MIRRMADKFGHLGQPKQSNHSANPPSASSSVLSTPSTSLEFHRGSISTERTSVSEWSKHGESMDVVEPEPATKLIRTITKPKGSYRLSDFIIQRTLGTGSFGRVHLGAHFRTSEMINTDRKDSPKQTQPSLLCHESIKQRQDRQNKTSGAHK